MGGPFLESEFRLYMAARVAIARVELPWTGGRVRLRATKYFDLEIPPEKYIKSARGILFHEDSVVHVRNLWTTHICPDGRCAANETLEETLRHDILKETGWKLHPSRLLGYIHHLTA